MSGERASAKTRARRGVRSPTHPHEAGSLSAALRPALHLALFGVALWAVDRVVSEYQPTEVLAALGRVPLPAVALAVIATALGYASLVGHDWIAFRILGAPRPLREIALPSFVSFAVSASAPGSMVTGGGVRYRMYRPHGVSAAQATRVALVDAVTWVLGLLLLAGATLASGRSSGVLGDRLSGGAARAFGIGALAVVGAYLALAAWRAGPARVGRFTLHVPTPRMAVAQIGLSLADWLLSSAALYILIRSVTRVSYPTFLGVFFTAQVGSLLLPVPGGLGVFEALVLVLAPRGAERPAVLAALLVYRVVYYLLPLALAGTLVLSARLAEERGSPGERLRRGIRSLAPHALAAITFVSGALLFLTGAIPRDERRVAWLVRLFPPALVDASQFLASVVGAALLVVAWGLELRSRPAYRVAVLLFGWGILLSVTRSSDATLSLAMAVVLALLLASRTAFTAPPPAREGPPWSVPWAFAVGAALLVSLWIGLWSQRWAEARGETWWRFTLFGGAPAQLRAAAGAAVALLLAGLVRVVGRARPAERSTTAARSRG